MEFPRPFPRPVDAGVSGAQGRSGPAPNPAGETCLPGPLVNALRCVSSLRDTPLRKALAVAGAPTQGFPVGRTWVAQKPGRGQPRNLREGSAKRHTPTGPIRPLRPIRPMEPPLFPLRLRPVKPHSAFSLLHSAFSPGPAPDPAGETCLPRPLVEASAYRSAASRQTRSPKRSPGWRTDTRACRQALRFREPPRRPPEPGPLGQMPAKVEAASRRFLPTPKRQDAASTLPQPPHRSFPSHATTVRPNQRPRNARRTCPLLSLHRHRPPPRALLDRRRGGKAEVPAPDLFGLAG